MNEKNKQLSVILKGGLLLTLASFISKVLSAIYKVPFQNWTGDAGFYVYQQVYPIYGLGVALTVTGLPTFISKIVSESKDDHMLQKQLQSLYTWLILLGVGLFFVLQIGATTLARGMGDVQLSPVIRNLSYFFLFLPFVALARGFFQGQVNMIPTSISQVSEQLIRVAILLAVAYYFTTGGWSVYEMGANAYHSGWLSALVASLVLGIYLQRHQQWAFFKTFMKPHWSWEMGQRLFSEGFLLIVVSSLMVLFQFVDSFTVFNGLLATNIPNDLAMSLKGIYDRGQPLVQLGLVVGMGFSMTSLPVLRKNVLAGELEEWQDNVTSIIRVTILLASAATVGLIAVMPWMNVTLFTNQAGTSVLQVLVVSILLMSLIYCLHLILQSANQVHNSWLIIMFGLSFKIMMNTLAVRYLGIMGSSVVTVCSLIIILVFMMQYLAKDIWSNVFKDHFIIKQSSLLIGLYLVVASSMTLIERITLITGRSSAFLLVLIGVLVGGLFYGLGILKLKLLNESELKQLKIPKVLRRK